MASHVQDSLGLGTLDALEVSLAAPGLSTSVSSFPMCGARLDSAEAIAELGAFKACELAQ